jgi:hypothetical protein
VLSTLTVTVPRSFTRMRPASIAAAMSNPSPLASGDMALWALIKKQYGAMLTSLCRSHRIDRRDRGFLAPRWTHDKRAGAARQSTAQKSINLYYPAAEGLGVRDFRMNSGD